MATQGLRQLIFIEHPHVIFPSIATALAIPALASTPSFVPTTLLIACLLVYSKLIAHRSRMAVHLVVSWLLVSVGQTIGDFAVSRNAVASPVGAFVSAFILSLVSSGIHLLLIFADTISGRLAMPWARVTFFPALWSTGIQIIANVSPLGYLMTWSPTTGIDSYEWMRPVFGPWGVNWVVAALAIVGAELVGAWFINETPEEDSAREPELVPLIPPKADHASSYAAMHGSRHVALLAGAILILAIPSYFIQPILVAPYSSSSSPIVAGCILPQSKADGGLTFEDYLVETSRAVSLSKRVLLLWPESAVRFESESDRQSKLEQLAKVQKNGYIAISYEQPEPNAGQRSGLRRNGILVQGPDGIVLDYHKRHLVPFVESFPLAKGSEDPAVVMINMPVTPIGRENRVKLRSISLTASICLDFAFPGALSGISQRAALVLAPARTWHPDVSRAMWEQTRARVSEMGGTALFCDGGEGGFSGVASAGMREPTQIGPGTWTRTIGVHWPLDDRKTAYAAVGDWMMFFIVWMVMGVGTFGEMAALRVARRVAPSRGSVTAVVRQAYAALTRNRWADAERGQTPQGEQESLI